MKRVGLSIGFARDDMDIFNKRLIAELEDTNEVYRERNKQLEQEVKELKEFRLKYKIAQMLIDDDPAIDELLTAHKAKSEFTADLNRYARDNDYYRSHQFASQQQAQAMCAANRSAFGQLGAPSSIGSTGGIFGFGHFTGL